MSTTDQQLADLISSLTDRMASGENVGLEQVCAEHPELADHVRELWGAIAITQAIGRGSTGDDIETAPAGILSSELPIRMGDYMLTEELGRGGMGVVYKARQISLGRDVAIKMILKGELASERDLQRFHAEAEAIAKLSHPHIIPIYEVDDFDGRAFFCMKLVEGSTLADRLAQGPVGAKEAARIMHAICEAIEYAHSQGVLHRDLKPSNILIENTGNVFLADFGLAKQIKNAASLTRSGAVIGTPAYMAPEQAAGDRGDVNELSDVYSLGAILYHMITGAPPFHAATPVDTVLMVLEQDPIPAKILNRNADRDLDIISQRCLQKPPDLRYGSVTELLDDIRAYLKDEPVKARNARFGQIVVSWFRETHHAPVLENWGLLWMWHSLVLILVCTATNVLYWIDPYDRWPYVVLWIGGFGAWALVFWWLRRWMGPITFVERQVAHVWFASMLCISAVFPLEMVVGLAPLKLAPMLGLVASMTFICKAGMLTGRFYFQAAALIVAAIFMAVFTKFALIIFGMVAAVCFFIPGFQYHRRRRRGIRSA